MRALFLDIDGVLNSDETEVFSKNGNFVFIEDKYIARLKKIVDATQCSLVLTGHQRRAFLKSERSVDRKFLNEITEKLAESGLTIMTHVEDLKNVSLEDEIWGWLREHRDSIESYCVLDDKMDAHGSLGSRLVRTDMLKGLTDENVAACIRLLKNPVGPGDLINE